MGKIEEAQEILKSLGLPSNQQNEISALIFLALCNIKENDAWQSVKRQSLTITKGIMNFVAKNYGREYAPNTRETFRRQVLHQFIQARLVDYNPDATQLPTNSPRAHYAISKAAIEVIKAFGSKDWENAKEKFLSEYGRLISIYQKKRKQKLIPVRLINGKILELSHGKHNKLQADIINSFAPRFAPGSTVLYIGDTAKKNLYVEKEKLCSIGINITDHDKLPDIVLLDKAKNWLFLIEVVTSHGPMTPKRVIELEIMFSKCNIGKIYVSAFPDFVEFRKHIKEIAWETEVWISDTPDHMIHYNGDHFLGPRQ